MGSSSASSVSIFCWRCEGVGVTMQLFLLCVVGYEFELAKLKDWFEDISHAIFIPLVLCVSGVRRLSSGPVFCWVGMVLEKGVTWQFVSVIWFELTWLRNTLCYSSVTNYLSQIYFTRNFEAKLMQDYLLNEVGHLSTLLFITEYDSTIFCYFLFNNFKYCIKAIHNDKSVL